MISNYAFLYAARDNDIETVRLAIGAGKDLNVVYEHGMTGLMHAAKEGSIEMVKFLTSQGCNVHQLSNNGDSALSWAWACENTEVGKEIAVFLLQQGVSYMTANSYGKTLMDNVREHPDPEFLAILEMAEQERILTGLIECKSTAGNSLNF